MTYKKFKSPWSVKNVGLSVGGFILALWGFGYPSILLGILGAAFMIWGISRIWRGWP